MADEKTNQGRTDAPKKEGAPRRTDAPGKEKQDNWLDNAPDSVKEYEKLRANPPENQKDLTPKPE